MLRQVQCCTIRDGPLIRARARETSSESVRHLVFPERCRSAVDRARPTRSRCGGCQREQEALRGRACGEARLARRCLSALASKALLSSSVTEATVSKSRRPGNAGSNPAGREPVLADTASEGRTVIHVQFVASVPASRTACTRGALGMRSSWPSY